MPYILFLLEQIKLYDYYLNHYNRKDLLTGEPIPFKNYDQYFSDNFINENNFREWLAKSPDYQKRAYLLSQAEKRFEEKNITVSPPNLYYILSKMAEIDIYEDLWGSYEEFNKALNVKNIYNNDLPENFWDALTDDIQIMVDTREQLPLNFKNTLSNKLDFGDYTVGGDLYSKTFVERKSLGDFKSTFGKGVERFKNEMLRCVEFESYMFVVVESSVEKINEENLTSKFKSNMTYVWHNVKDVIASFPENIQFIFAHSRGGAKKIIPKILFHGDKLWNVDLQHQIEKRIHGLEQRKSKV